MTLRARHLHGARFNALPIPARRTDGIREREYPAQALDHARLASHNRPPLRWMIANLEKATIDWNVVTIHIEDDDVARRDPHDWIPRATTQCVRAGGTDACPTLHLQLRWSDLSRCRFHALTLPWPASASRDWSHKPVVIGSAALREAANVTFRTSLDECQLRATVRAGADEILFGTPCSEHGGIAGGALNDLARHR